jgi:hypothetical protein
MTVWLVQAGSYGEREDLALERNFVVIGWEDLPDLSGVTSREALQSLCHEVYPEEKLNTIRNWVGQVWAFIGRIKEGDLVGVRSGGWTPIPAPSVEATSTRPTLTAGRVSRVASSGEPVATIAKTQRHNRRPKRVFHECGSGTRSATGITAKRCGGASKGNVNASTLLPGPRSPKLSQYQLNQLPLSPLLLKNYAS